MEPKITIRTAVQQYFDDVVTGATPPRMFDFPRARLSFASYFTFATTAVTRPSKSARVDASSSVWYDACVTSLFSLACSVVGLLQDFLELVKVRHRI